MRCPECKSLQIKNVDTISATGTNSHRGYLVRLINTDEVTLRRKRCMNPDCLNDFWTQEIIIERPKALRKPGGQKRIISNLNS